MPSPANLVHMQSATTGTGNFTVAAVNGKQAFGTAFGTGATTNVFDYFISNQSAAEWERGTGHMSNSTTLVRDTVIESTNSNAAVSFSAGTKDIVNDVPAANQVRNEGSTVTDGHLVVMDGTTGRKVKSAGFAPREVLTASRTYYVRPDGSDSNTGLANTSGGAFLTLQKACDVVYGTLDLGGFDATIQVAAASTPATFTAGVSITSPQVGKGKITLLGDTTTPANFVISTSGDCVSVAGSGSVLNVRGFKLVMSADAGMLHATTGGRINFGKIEFGAATTQYHMRADNAGSIGLVSGDDYKITGGGAGHILELSNGLIALSSITVTLTGTPAWSVAFANIQGAQLSLFNITWSGSATGSRYSVVANGVINSFGAGSPSTYFPGNSNGTQASGGQQI